MRNKHLRFESLERRLLLASDGWDGPGLGDASLTYYIGDVPNAIDETDFRETIAAAFAAWTDVVDIEIQETSLARQRDSIDITFGEIDGPGDVLAQAYLPDDVNRGRIAGDIVFDVDESWEFGNERGREATDLMIVSVHEIGHSLGLEHLDNQDSVMYESVSPNSMFTGLDQLDTDAILALYAPQSITLQGDFDLDGALTADDIDLLFQLIGSGDFDSRFDLNVDDVVDHLDSDVLIKKLFGTTYGDANLDGVVDAQDLNQVALNWQVEDNLGWRDGDFTGDGLIDAADLNRIGSNWSVAANHKEATLDSIPIVMVYDENTLFVDTAIDSLPPETEMSPGIQLTTMRALLTTTRDEAILNLTSVVRTPNVLRLLGHRGADLTWPFRDAERATRINLPKVIQTQMGDAILNGIVDELDLATL